jgi:hypothetical protein
MHDENFIFGNWDVTVLILRSWHEEILEQL